MSLLTDRDYLLHSFQLSFVRSVLPNHAISSLISFPSSSGPSSSSYSSPYITLSGLSDTTTYPELHTGRNSPPLGLAHARGGLLDGSGSGSGHPSGSGRAGRRTGGGLNYSQTIGKGVVGPGMRVDGPRRGNWRNHRQNNNLKGELDTTTAEESGVGEESGTGSGFVTGAEDGPPTAVGPPVAIVPSRKGSLETSLHHRRVLSSSSTNGIIPAGLPPVVIHSPVRTPQDSPSSPTLASQQQPPPPFPSSSHFQPPLHHSKRSAMFIPSSSSSSSILPSGLPPPDSPLFTDNEEPLSLVDPDPDGTSASDSDSQLVGHDQRRRRRSLPLSTSQTTGSDLAYSLAGRTGIGGIGGLESPGSPLRTTLVRHDEEEDDDERSYEGSDEERRGLQDREDSSEEEEEGEVSEFEGVPVFESVASSGVSLFGTSRMDGANSSSGGGRDGANHGGMIGGDDSSQSDTSSFSLAAPRSGLSRSALTEQLEVPFNVDPQLLHHHQPHSPTSSQPQPPSTTTTTISSSPSSNSTSSIVPIVPRNFRARERRRVNISGRMLVPISEPTDEEDHGAHSTPPSLPSSSTAALPPPVTYSSQPSTQLPQIDTSHAQPVRARSYTDPTTTSTTVHPPTSQPIDSTDAIMVDSPLTTEPPSTRPELRRKHSAPSLLPAQPTLAPPPIQIPPINSTSSSISTPTRSSHSHHHHHPTLTFSRTPLKPPSSQPPKSLLSTLLNSSDSTAPPNPFSSLYLSLITRPPTESLQLSLFFPHSKEGRKGLKVGVRKDVSVEEVIGVGLLCYWEEGREPKLVEKEDEGEEGETRTECWNLRIVEDDGEVDEDFPALDRTRAISAFSFNMFAIVKATPQQIKDNTIKQSSIQRRPSRVLAPQKRAIPPPNLSTKTSIANLAAPQLQPPTDASFRPGTTLGVSSALAIPVLLKVRLPPTPGVEAIETTIQVPNDMYMSDVLDHLCKKRGLENPKEWTLIAQPVPPETHETAVALDRTVLSLTDPKTKIDHHSLKLVRRVIDPALAKGKQKAMENTNPNSSIFKRLSEPPQPKYKSATEISSTYQKYNVQRKLPMPLGRHPRTITIDGDYIHFLPTDTKTGILDGGRTSSFHISNVHDVKVSKRAPTTFKILVQKDRVEKRYDFEAENQKLAQEIVANIRGRLIAWREGHV